MWLFPRRIAWGRNDRVGDGDLAQSGLSDEPGVFEVGVGLAVDLQIDFTHGVAPGLAALSGGHGPGVEDDLSGAPVRSVIVLQYTTSALIAYVAGLITATAVSSVNTAVATSPLIYDVILVVELAASAFPGITISKISPARRSPSYRSRWASTSRKVGRPS
jgi:hypothetical protein